MNTPLKPAHALRLSALINQVIDHVTPGRPNRRDVRKYLRQFFKERAIADAFYNRMQLQHWRDREGRLVSDWRAVALKYANAFVRNRRLES